MIWGESESGEIPVSIRLKSRILCYISNLCYPGNNTLARSVLLYLHEYCVENVYTTKCMQYVKTKFFEFGLQHIFYDKNLVKKYNIKTHD